MHGESTDSSFGISSGQLDVNANTDADIRIPGTADTSDDKMDSSNDTTN